MSPTSTATSSDTIVVRIDRLVPTQLEIGMASAREIVHCWRKEAQTQGLEFVDFARDVLEPRLKRPEYKTVPCVLGPSGTIYITDAHHTVWALLQVERETGIELSLKLRVESNYRGFSLEEFAHHFLDVRQKGQFPEAFRHLPSDQRIRLLPASFADLSDNPLRSAVGRVFYLAAIRSSYVHDYAEFEVGAALVKAGLLDCLKERGLISEDAAGIPAELAYDPRLVQATHEKLFGDPDLVAFLQKKVRENRAAEAANAIARACSFRRAA